MSPKQQPRQRMSTTYAIEFDVDDDVSREPRYAVTAVATRVGVRIQTLRRYEEYGLLEPMRSDEGYRLYSDADIARIERIRRLVNDLGVNLAGVAAILHLRNQLILSQRELHRLREQSGRD